MNIVSHRNRNIITENSTMYNTIIAVLFCILPSCVHSMQRLLLQSSECALQYPGPSASMKNKCIIDARTKSLLDLKIEATYNKLPKRYSGTTLHLFLCFLQLPDDIGKKIIEEHIFDNNPQSSKVYMMFLTDIPYAHALLKLSHAIQSEKKYPLEGLSMYDRFCASPELNNIYNFCAQHRANNANRTCIPPLSLRDREIIERELPKTAPKIITDCLMPDLWMKIYRDHKRVTVKVGPSETLDREDSATCFVQVLIDQIKKNDKEVTLIQNNRRGTNHTQERILIHDHSFFSKALTLATLPSLDTWSEFMLESDPAIPLAPEQALYTQGL
jgi:hypothetical protein